MPLPQTKQRIRNAFERAASTYDSAAITQRAVCTRLIETINLKQRVPHILDAGCGTGYGAQLLRTRWPSAHITGVDFSPAMLEYAKNTSDLCFSADIEDLPFTPQSFDLWWSNLSIQWCDYDRVFSEAARTLKSDGQIAFSTLGPETFYELRQAFAKVDSHRHTLPFANEESIRQALQSAGFKQINLRRERHIAHYPDLKTLLHAVKAIGAQTVGNGARQGMLGRSAWQQVQAAYEEFRQDAGLPASYDVLLCYAEK